MASDTLALSRQHYRCVLSVQTIPVKGDTRKSFRPIKTGNRIKQFNRKELGFERFLIIVGLMIVI